MNTTADQQQSLNQIPRVLRSTRSSTKWNCDICKRVMHVSTKNSHLGGKWHAREVKRSARKGNATQVITDKPNNAPLEFSIAPPSNRKNVVSRATQTAPEASIMPDGGHENHPVLIKSELTDRVLEAMEGGINSRISSADGIYRSILDSKRSVDRLDAEIASLLARRTDTIAQIVTMQHQIAPSIIATFPTEILVKIFRFCIGDSVILISGSRRATPLAELAEVCKRWRPIVMGTPSLWNSILLDFKNWADPNRLTNSGRKCLERTGTVLPISIQNLSVPHPVFGVIDRVSAVVQPVKALVIPFASRLKHLKLSFPYHWLRPLLDMPPGSMPIIESADIEFIYGGIGFRTENMDGTPTFSEDMTVFHRTPSLRHLTFRIHQHPRGTVVLNINLPHSGLQFPWPQFPWHQLTHLSFIKIRLPSEICHAVLQKSVNLVSCVLWLLIPHDSFTPSNTILFALKSLTLNIQECMTVDKFIKPCIFPALEHLELQGPSKSPWPPQILPLFVSRSCCYLTSLTILLPMPALTVMKILESVPYLTKLKLSDGCKMSLLILSQMKKWALVTGLQSLMCTLDPGLLKEFIDMYEDRWMNASASREYSHIQVALITCMTDGTLVVQAKERLNNLGEIGRGVTIHAHTSTCCDRRRPRIFFDE